MARGTATHNGEELVEAIRELADDLEFETEEPDGPDRYEDD